VSKRKRCCGLFKKIEVIKLKRKILVNQKMLWSNWMNVVVKLKSQLLSNGRDVWLTREMLWLNGRNFVWSSERLVVKREEMRCSNGRIAVVRWDKCKIQA